MVNFPICPPPPPTDHHPPKYCYSIVLFVAPAHTAHNDLCFRFFFQVRFEARGHPDASVCGGEVSGVGAAKGVGRGVAWRG